MKQIIQEKILLSVLLLLIHASAFCQITLIGTIKDKKTNQPLPYVNIGVIEKQVGTVSNSSGHFSLDVPEHMIKDSIRFSFVGYESYTVPVGFFSSRKGTALKIELNESNTKLKGIVISSTQLKRRVFGIKRESSISATSFNGFQEGPVEDLLGSEMGMKIKPKKYPSTLIDLNFFIRENAFDSIKLRVNIYPMKGEELQHNIVPTSIIVDVVNKQKGWIKVDLEKYDIVLDSEFVISLECIDYKLTEKKDFILIPTFFPSFQKTFQKYTSQDKWLTGSFGISFNVTLEY